MIQLLLLLPLISSLLARTQELPSFHIKSDLVVVDLIVTDQDGEFVRNLTLSEVSVYEDGKKQKISFFRLVGKQERQKKAKDLRLERAMALDPLAPGQSHMTDSASGTSLVILLDLNTVDPLDLDRAKDFIVNFMRSQLTPNDRVMIASIRHGLTIDQSFTSDSSKLIKAVEGIQPELRPKTSFTEFNEEAERIVTGGSIASIFSAPEQVRARAEQFLGNLRVSVGHTRDAISALIGHLRSLPGRKHIVYYSAGYPLNPEEYLENIIRRVLGWNRVEAFTGRSGKLVHRGDIRDALHFLTDRANRSQVSVYSVDVRGLKSSGWGDARRQGSLDPEYGLRLAADVTAPQDFLRSLSSDSGGLSFVNDNDLSKGLERAYLDTKEYYIIGYVPTTKRKKGKIHRIEVEVTRSKLNVRSRKEYIETDEDSLLQTDLLNALKFPELFQHFPLQIDVSVGSGKIEVKFFIPSPGIIFNFEDHRYQCLVEIFGVLVDSQGKWAGGKLAFARKFPVDIHVSDWFQQLKTEGRLGRELLAQRPDLAPTVEADAPPGKYNLIVVVRQFPANKITTATRQVTVE